MCGGRPAGQSRAPRARGPPGAPPHTAFPGPYWSTRPQPGQSLWPPDHSGPAIGKSAARCERP
eukprot:11172032-Lingulodinium_polyedra.AAC.1